MTTINVYLAGRYESMDVMREVREVWGGGKRRAVVTSRWIDGKHSDATRALSAVAATEDLEDIDAAEVLVIWSPREHFRTGRGGRHVEVGYALARGKRIILVGERENVFHHHPAIEQVADWPSAYEALWR